MQILPKKVLQVFNLLDNYESDELYGSELDDEDEAWIDTKTTSTIISNL